MDYDTILEKIRTGAYKVTVAWPTESLYPENHIFDEEKSVRWNREQVVKENAKIKNAKKAFRRSVADGQNRFRADVIQMILDGHRLNQAQAEKVYDLAYDRGHSNGFEDVLIYIDEYASFAEDIISLAKKGE